MDYFQSSFSSSLLQYKKPKQLLHIHQIHDWKLSIWSDRTRWMFCQKLSWFITTLVYIPKCSSGTNKDYVRYPSGKTSALCFVFEGSNNKTFLMEKRWKAQMKASCAICTEPCSESLPQQHPLRSLSPGQLHKRIIIVHHIAASETQ